MLSSIALGCSRTTKTDACFTDNAFSFIARQARNTMLGIHDNIPNCTYPATQSSEESFSLSLNMYRNNMKPLPNCIHSSTQSLNEHPQEQNLQQQSQQNHQQQEHHPKRSCTVNKDTTRTPKSRNPMLMSCICSKTISSEEDEPLIPSRKRKNSSKTSSSPSSSSKKRSRSGEVPNRKRKNSADNTSSSPSLDENQACNVKSSLPNTCGGNQTTLQNPPVKMPGLTISIRRPIIPGIENNKAFFPGEIPSPGSADQNTVIQKWLASCDPEPSSPPNEKVTEQHDSRHQVEKFVMVQVFTRDSLVKSDLIALPAEGQTSEICISHVGGIRQPKSDTRDFRSFQYQIFPENQSYCKQFIRQFGDGIRIYCDSGKNVMIQNSTSLSSFYGTYHTPDWVSIPHASSWEEVFTFPSVTPRRDHAGITPGSRHDNTGNLTSDFNPTTVCPANVVRMSVGCRPHPKQIYQTQFHIKLSFIAR